MERYRRGQKASGRQPRHAHRAQDPEASSEDIESSGADSVVGYRRPPKHSQFKPGASGNPKGRPKGSRNFKTDVKSTLDAAVKVTRDGKPRKISTQRAMLLRLREKALGGDNRALDRLILLAQAYNNEEQTVSAELSADDTTVLEIFKARLLSGGAEISDARDASGRANHQSGKATPLKKRVGARAPGNEPDTGHKGRRK